MLVVVSVLTPLLAGSLQMHDASNWLLRREFRFLNDAIPFDKIKT